MSSQDLEPQKTAPSEAAPEFWRRTPPALFPSIMGFMGLGLAWRAAVRFDGVSISPLVSMCLLGLCCILFLFILACYLSKLSVRVGVIMEDLASVPGRAGVSAMSVSTLLFAAAMAPLSPLVASVALFAGLSAHVLIGVLIVITMARTERGFVVTPAWHLSFVGFIVACLAAVPLGYTALAQLILGVTVLLAALIYGVSLLQLSKAEVAPPLRPLLFIHLAPLSLFASVASLLGQGLIAIFFAALAIGLAAVLVSRIRYITQAGFSPLWGAFTFPVAALSSALFSLSSQATVFGWLALIPLAVATFITPLIVLRVLRMWSTGALAEKTGAATA
ncbi:MAG: tellurium resistance protein [Planktotalea sp.]|uniref:SLAC1 family transporter n=1 Tax=Planktotalea sp. TaxID=2029877 RepID=UPI003C7407FB